MFHVFSALWLEPDVPITDRGKIVNEFRSWLANNGMSGKIFPKLLLRQRTLLALIPKEEFRLCVTAQFQLNIHIAGSSPTPTLAQDAFKHSACKVEVLRYAGDPLPSQKKKTERSNVFNVWLSA